MRIILFLLFSSTVSYAAVDESQFALCAAIATDADRLECFDQLVLSSGVSPAQESNSEVSEEFLQSIVLVRPGILDLGEMSVSDFILRITSPTLSDGNKLRTFGWTQISNQYRLKIQVLGETTDLLFIHDLSDVAGGKYSLLQPIGFMGEQVSALEFSLLMLSQ